MTVIDAQRLQRELFLRAMFPTMPLEAQVRFIELMDDATYEEGETLFEAGELADRFMFLMEGTVVMERPGERAWQFSDRSVVGVIDAVLERTRTRSCRALRRSQTLIIRTADWFDMLEDNAQIARAAVRNFASQLHARWRQLGARLPQGSEPPPPFAPEELTTYDKILALRRAAFLKRAGMQAVVSLAQVAESIPLAAGAKLFDVGEAGDNLYVVVRGLVELRHAPDFRFVHDAGDLVGASAAFCHALPTYSASAVSESLVLRISEQDFYDQAEEHGRLTRGTLAYLVSELEELLAVEPATVQAPSPR